LDEAVFDLFNFTTAERDLVQEMCTAGLDLFYQNQNSNALREVIRPHRNVGTLADVAQAKDGLSAYLGVFLKAWNAELAPDGEFVWRLLSPPSRAPLMAVSFKTHYKNSLLPENSEDDAQAWRAVLAKLDRSSRVHADSSRIFVDSFFRYVSESEILFIKRNERRFWTRTAAREDAESALTYLMNSNEAAQGGKR
jgi:hypothetical protein